MELTHTAIREGRLSSFLLGELGMSGGLINRLKWGDAIRVDGVPQHTDFPVKPGNVITVRLDEPRPEYPAEDGALSILYEDAHLLIVDKPAGMLIHPSRSQNTGTLANFVAGHYRRTGQSSAFHPVTRLDRDTFGVVLLGKNSHIHTLLQNTSIEKTYEALVFGCPPEDAGRVEASIARRELPSLLRYIDSAGKPAVTEYRVLERFGTHSRLWLRPVTGRTHQLRLHCAHIGCPILGDPQYNTAASAAFSQEMGLSYQLLCAKRLEFCHPVTGERLCVESGLGVV